ncbi:MAG: DUF4440 domain-containing protein [Alphaproteobacteria bacterium]|nr:DUF4440 domain-containing protein [Alphaproteobacteria bacterium]
MTEHAAFTPDEVKELRKLLDVEKIRKVKQMYSHLMDSRNIDALAEILAEDAVCEFGPYGTWHGKKEIHEGWKAVFKDAIPYGGFHATTNMWIEMTGPDTAISRTYLHDISNEPDPRADPVVWYGVYDEDFERINGEWKLKKCRLQFLWPKRLISDNFPRPMTPSSFG